jgi:hypothetical protein
VVLVIVLIAAAAALAGAGLARWVSGARSCGRGIGAPDSDPDALYLGDVMCRYVLTSGSLARLEFFDWGVRLRGTLVSRWIVPTWEARYEDLAIAELVALRWSRTAVWLRLRGEKGGIGFLSDRSQDVLGELEKRGVPVDRSVARFTRVAELYSR